MAGRRLPRNSTFYLHFFFYFLPIIRLSQAPIKISHRLGNSKSWVRCAFAWPPSRRGRIRSEKKVHYIFFTGDKQRYARDLLSAHHYSAEFAPAAHSPHSINDRTPALSRFAHLHFSTNVIDSLGIQPMAQAFPQESMHTCVRGLYPSPQLHALTLEPRASLQNHTPDSYYCCFKYIAIRTGRTVTKPCT